MKNIFSLLMFVFMVSALFAQQDQGSPVIENISKVSFTETIDNIKSSAEQEGWKVLVIHDLQASLKKNGQDVLPVSVIELCKPAFSGPLLKVDDYRSLSVFMPCRVSVYETENGDIKISRMNMSLLDNSSFNKDAVMQLNKASEEMENILSALFKE